MPRNGFIASKPKRSQKSGKWPWCLRIRTIVFFILVNQWIGVSLHYYISFLDCESPTADQARSEAFFVPRGNDATTTKPSNSTLHNQSNNSLHEQSSEDESDETFLDSESSITSAEDDDYIWQSPRLYLNLTIWSSNPSLLEQVSLMEHIKEGLAPLRVRKQLCVRGNNETKLPSCPKPNLCSTHFFDASGECMTPEFVIDEVQFWKNIKDMTLYLNVTAFHNETEGFFENTKSYFRLTSWDMLAKAHHLMDKAKFDAETCVSSDNPKKTNHEICPGHCDFQGTIWDPRDEMCKTIDPERQWVGQCSCEHTCMTPQAGPKNSSWPWKSEDEREDYYGDRTNKEIAAFQTKRRACRMGHYKKQPNQYFRESTSCSVVETNKTSSFELSCEAHATGWNHLYFVPQAKLIFCGIPKNGVSEWLKLFRHLIGAGDYLSFPHFKEDLTEFQLSRLPQKKAEALLKDPNWTKAVIWRDPAERLLSAYLDKIVDNDFTKRFFRIPDKTLSFEEFVNLTAGTTGNFQNRLGAQYRSDPHWKPQLFTCGLDQLLPLFDFVGSFDKLSEHSWLLLRGLGIWDSHGKEFDSSHKKPHTDGATNSPSQYCTVPPPNFTDPSTVAVGFNQHALLRNIDTERHKTGSKEKMDKFYTPHMYATVRKAYAMDYAVWDELNARTKRNPMNIASGHRLKLVKESCAINID